MLVLDEKVLLMGPSHVKRWMNEISQGGLSPVKNIELYGGGGWPLFSKKMKKRALSVLSESDRIYFMVPDFRIGNSVLKDTKTLVKNFYSEAKYKFIDKDLINAENDAFLYENGMRCLDWYVEEFGEKIKFIFWCTYMRERINIKQQKFLTSGKYLHPTWNYEVLSDRYKSNHVDLHYFNKCYADFILKDGTVHPNFKGYDLIEKLCRGISGEKYLDEPLFKGGEGDKSSDKPFSFSGVSLTPPINYVEEKEINLPLRAKDTFQLIKQLDSLGAKIPFLNLKKSKNLVFELPISIAKSTSYNFSIGAYTYMGSGRYNGLTKIGRFCSVANNVAIGLFEHPVEHLTTNPVGHDVSAVGTHFGDYPEVMEYLATNKVDSSWKEKINTLETHIGNDVWVGHDVFIKKGVKIGNGAVVAGKSVVLKDVPPYSIVAGVPATIIRYRFSPEVIDRLLSIKWWEYPLNILDGVSMENIEEGLNQIQKNIDSGAAVKKGQELYTIKNGYIETLA